MSNTLKLLLLTAIFATYASEAAIKVEASDNILEVPSFWYNEITKSPNKILVFNEAQGVSLNSVKVQYVNKWDDLENLLTVQLSEDALVDSHMIYYHKEDTQRLEIVAEIEFDSPIIGFLGDSYFFGGENIIFAPDPTHRQPADRPNQWSLEEHSSWSPLDRVDLLTPTRIRISFTNQTAIDPLRVLTLRRGTSTPSIDEIMFLPEHHHVNKPFLGETKPAAPSIENQPQDTSKFIGQRANFAVRADGFPIPQYQWLKDGEPIPGANSSMFTILEVKPEDAGKYSVQISNKLGVITSEEVTLSTKEPVTFRGGNIDFEQLNTGTNIGHLLRIGDFRFRCFHGENSRQNIIVRGPDNGYASTVILPQNHSGRIVLDREDGKSFDIVSFEYATNVGNRRSDLIVTAIGGGDPSTEYLPATTKEMTKVELNWENVTSVSFDWQGGENNVQGSIDNIFINLR